jgi:tetratricopeptide (TPR) repeat protein
VGDVASPREIDAAIEAYRVAMGRDKGNVDVRWKYLRATYFKAEYTGLAESRKTALYDRAKGVAEEALDLLRTRAGRQLGRDASGLEAQEIATALAGDQTAGEAFYWTAVTWGQWALARGKLKAVQEGAASKIRSDCRIVIGIDSKLEDGGGYRVLGRLHAVTPKVPLLTPWIDHDEAVANLRKAVAVAPLNFVNLLFLAEALQEFTGDKAEATRLLGKVVQSPPDPDHLVESLRTQAAARRDLQRWRAEEQQGD